MNRSKAARPKGTTARLAKRPARYLDLLAIQQGDLILTGTTDRVSDIIAKHTGGPFSHVAIVRSVAQRFEALGDGVGLTNHQVDRFELRHGRLRALMRIEEPHCMIIRHRAATIDDNS